MRTALKISFLIFIAMLHEGCSDNSSVSASKSLNTDGKASENLKPLVVVNGVSYTSQDMESEIELRKVLLSRFPKKSALLSEQGIRKMRFQILESVLPKLCLQAEAKKLGVSVNASTLKALEEKMANPFKLKGESPEKFFEFLDVKNVYPTFKRIATTEATINELLRVKYTNEFDVTEAEIGKAMAHALDYNEKAQKKNQEIYVLASNIVNRVSAGEDFSALAKKYSAAEQEEVENGGRIGEWDESDAKHIDPDLWGKLNALSEGAISDVVETDIGLFIFKVNKRVTHSEATGDFALDLSRIELHRVVLYPEYTREEIRSLGKKQARSICLEKELQNLFGTLDVKTPSGTNEMVKVILGTHKKGR